MEKLLQLFTRFYLAIAILGFILILLSVSTGLKLPGLEEIVPDSASRIISLSAGMGLIALSTIIYYIETKKKGNTMILKKNETEGTGDGGKKKFNKNDLTETQRKLLYEIELYCIEHEAINQKALEQKHKQMHGAELYYRLECLILQGYLVKDSAGIENSIKRYIYKLSDEYCLQSGIKINRDDPNSTKLTPS